jgi:hypothetical protein
MTLFSQSGWCALGAIAAAMLVIQSAPASAQGNIACEFGSTRYKRCCAESYRRNPDLDVLARGRDIDRCIARRGAPDDKPAAAEKPAPTPPPAPTSAIRRIDCLPTGCDRCQADEMAISAFCNVGAFPTMSRDGSVACSTSSGTEPPTVIMCAKK